MDLRQLAVLRAIAESGTFYGAADQLGLTQPAVTHQLKRLESELGETLVLRRKPRVALSSAGMAVLSVAHRVLTELDELKQQFVTDDETQLAGVLRVTASALGIIYLYGDLLERFIAGHPRIELVLTATETPLDGLRQVVARAADAAFVAFPLDVPNLTEMVLGETEHVILVARSHPLASRSGVSIQELSRYPFIRYKTGAGSRLISDAMFLPRGGYPEIFLESNDTEFVKRIVGLGFATAVAPRFVVTKEARDRRLKSLTLRDMALKQKYGLVHRADTRMRALKLFADFCASNKQLVPS